MLKSSCQHNSDSMCFVGFLVLVLLFSFVREKKNMKLDGQGGLQGVGGGEII